MPPSTPKLIDINKQYTADGQEVKIIDITSHEVTFATKTPMGDWYCSTRDLYGRTSCPWHKDLVEVPETKKLDVWVNVYPDAISTPNAYFDRTTADRHAGISRIACVHVVQDYKVGEGLS